MNCKKCQVAEDFCISLPAEITSFEQLKTWVQSVADRFSLPAKMLRKILVAFDEIFTNIAHYAYPDQKGSVDVCARYDAQNMTVSFTFCDTGIPFDPLTHEDPDVGAHSAEQKIGGLGIFMVKKLMDNVVYRRENGHNRLMISKHFESCAS